jgi:hypothetical protein
MAPETPVEGQAREGGEVLRRGPDDPLLTLWPSGSSDKPACNSALFFQLRAGRESQPRALLSPSRASSEAGGDSSGTRAKGRPGSARSSLGASSGRLAGAGGARGAASLSGAGRLVSNGRPAGLVRGLEALVSAGGPIVFTHRRRTPPLFGPRDPASSKGCLGCRAPAAERPSRSYGARAHFGMTSLESARLGARPPRRPTNRGLPDRSPSDDRPWGLLQSAVMRRKGAGES